MELASVQNTVDMRHEWTNTLQSSKALLSLCVSACSAQCVAHIRTPILQYYNEVVSTMCTLA